MKEKKYLYDIINSISLIRVFLTEVASFNDYSKDLKTKSAVERQLGIIGEAVNKYQKITQEQKLENGVQIINLRNRLVHAYAGIDDSIIWAIINKHLQPLKEEVENLLKE
jgi:uncharacterized protein with HEPN domain